MKCIVCGKEFEGRADAKYCSVTCRSKAHRATDNATDSKINVATDKLSVANATDNATDKKDPLKRITKPPLRATEEWYKSDGYKNLIEELEKKSIEQLEKEGYMVPAWKYAGHKKKPNLQEILNGLSITS